MAKTITNTIVMVRPASFGYNAETAENNAFQSKDGATEVERIKNSALQEFDTMVEQLKSKGIAVIIHEDDVYPAKPDAVFPNNWFSCHSSGTIVTYPMYADSRKLERSTELIQKLMADYNFNYHIGLEAYEKQNLIVEGTGSMILDRVNKLCYACLSLRTNEELIDIFCERMGYKKVVFDALDRNSYPIYHTNVMMALGVDFCVVCLDTIQDEKQKEKVLQHLESTRKTVIDISLSQMENFAGNMLQLDGAKNPILVMSQTAYDSLHKEQIEIIEKHTEIIAFAIPTIEKYGGGSVRCMIAEIFC